MVTAVTRRSHALTTLTHLQVASVVGRTEILCSLFFLTTILTYQKAIHNQNGEFSNQSSTSNNNSLITGAGWKWVLSSMFFCLCSFLSKEQGITAMAVCIAYEMFIVLKVRHNFPKIMKHSSSNPWQMDFHSLFHLLKNLTSHPEKLSKPQRRFLLRAAALIVFVLAVAFIRMKLMQGTPTFSR